MVWHSYFLKNFPQFVAIYRGPALGTWGHFSLSCIGEGNRNPLQCSCLKNPRDEGAWWAAVYGVALRGQTRRL